MENRHDKPSILLRTVLLLVGITIIAIGINTGLGGIHTLGLQVPPDFIEIVDAKDYAVQDSHTRFLGGFWLGAGLLFISGCFRLERQRSVLVILLLMGFVGGLARFSALDLNLLLGPDVLPSLAFELAGFPLLAFWLHKSANPQLADS